MKIETFLSRIAVIGVVATFAGITLDTRPLALFAAAAATLVLLIVSGDYGRSPSRIDALVTAACRRERLPLAG